MEKVFKLVTTSAAFFQITKYLMIKNGNKKVYCSSWQIEKIQLIANLTINNRRIKTKI
jgi:hypothetical protein